jgi:hypothetical protein
MYLKVVEFLIDGRPFLFQTFEGVVYHVSNTVTRINTWSSSDQIVALVDADKTLIPESFLRHPSVQLIAASSPASTEQARLWNQGDTSSYVFKLVVDLWSPNELFITGFVISLPVWKFTQALL